MDLSPAQSGTDDKILSERIHPVVDQVVIRVPRAPRNGLAQSLQYRRLQLYIALLVMDALALVGAFALAGFVYDDGRGLSVAMMPAYLLLPLFQTIALYNAAYSQGGLEDWKRSLGRGVMALLITVPAISPMEQKPWDWYWTFNVKAMQRLFGEAFGAANVEVAAHGNAFAATCFIQGIAVEDVGSDWLTPLDETFPVLLTMKATKARD
jgi:hypothetical protein